MTTDARDEHDDEGAPDFDRRRFGERLHAQRLELGLTLEHVAGALRMAPSQLANIEAGMLAFPRSRLATLAYVIGRFYGSRLRDREALQRGEVRVSPQFADSRGDT